MGDNSIVCRCTPVAVYGYKQYYQASGGGPYVVPIINILVRHKAGGGLYFFKTG